MKQLTCKQLGGSCDTSITGSTPEELAANGTKHLAEAHPDMASKMSNMTEGERSTWTSDVLMPLWNAA